MLWLINCIFKDIINVISVPFTIQRICEVILNPDEYYKDVESVIQAFNKVYQLYNFIYRS